MKKVNVYQMEHKVVDVPDGKMYWERLEKQKLPEVTKVMGANVNPRETIKIIQLPIRTHVTRHESPSSVCVHLPRGCGVPWPVFLFRLVPCGSCRFPVAPADTGEFLGSPQPAVHRAESRS